MQGDLRETAVEKKANCMHNCAKDDAFFEWKLLAFSWWAYFAKNTIVLPDWLSDRAWLSFIATAPRRDFASTEHHN